MSEVSTKKEEILNIQMACDIIEIQNLLSTYAYSIDEKQFDHLDNVFTSDCKFHYVIEGGRSIVGEYPRMKDWIARTLGDFAITEHFIGLPRIRVDGDEAAASTMLFNPMLLSKEYSDQLFFVGGIYHDRLQRTSDGWRIYERREMGTWILDPPQGWRAPEIAA